MTADMPDAVKVLESAEKALRPFADRIFNDNGDMTLSGTHTLTLDDYAAAYYAHRKVEAAILGARAMQAAMPAPAGVRGKALEWKQSRRGGRYRLIAQTIIGEYALIEERGAFVLAGPDGKSIERLRTYKKPADGIPVAQAHFDQAIFSALKDAGAREGAEADTRLNAEKGGFDHPAALATKQPADSRSDPALGTAREAPDMAGDKVGVSTLASTPAGAGDLVERARNAERNITGRLRDTGWTPTRAGIESARNHIRDLASRIEALEAEVARYKRLLDLEAADHDAASTRATTAEADLAALRAEVVPQLLRGQTFAVQHNPNCPSPWLVRLPGESGVIDLKPYGGWMVAHETGDRLGFGLTFDAAARAAFALRTEDDDRAPAPDAPGLVENGADGDPDHECRYLCSLLADDNLMPGDIMGAMHRIEEKRADTIAAIQAEVETLQASRWREDEPRRDGVPFLGMDIYTMRWTPYSKKSEQYKRGWAGRWQRAGEHGGWDNCPTPQAWKPDPQYARAALPPAKAGG